MRTVILDIETIPDREAIRRCHHVDDGSFLPLPLHALACASMLIVDRVSYKETRFRIVSHSRGMNSERGIVSSVERELESAQMLLTFNGRAFDIPVLAVRAALTGEIAPTIMGIHVHSRSPVGKHSDLLQGITQFGGAPKFSLNAFCAALSIPCKIEKDGKRVAQLVAEEDWPALSNYCERDVVATYLAAKHWEGAQYGQPEAVLEAWAGLAGWIQSDQPALEHLLPFANPPRMHGGGDVLGDADFLEINW